jgi:Uma2 family endonuclease
MNVSDTPQRTRFDVDQYHRMGEAGIFPPDARLELIDGEILTMAPIGVGHAFAVNMLHQCFVTASAKAGHFVADQSPIILSDLSEPQPDLILLRGPASRYARRHPRPADVLLLIEVAESTLEYDRRRKIPLYATAGIPEVWILDIQGRRLERFTGACGHAYASHRVDVPPEPVSPSLAPGIRIDWASAVPD